MDDRAGAARGPNGLTSADAEDAREGDVHTGEGAQDARF
jgi:hypothetical protein